MSQAKVDKRKYEKRHRKELEKKRKIKTIITVTAVGLIIGAIIGVPTGFYIYRAQPKIVGASVLKDHIGAYIEENHKGILEIVRAYEASQPADTTEEAPQDTTTEETTGETTQDTTTEETTGETTQETTTEETSQ